MLSAAIIMVLVSIAASMFIRIGAFAIFAIFVACGFAVAEFSQGASVLAALLSAFAMLALMEIAYLVGLALSSLMGRSNRLPKQTANNNVPARGEHERG